MTLRRAGRTVWLERSMLVFMLLETTQNVRYVALMSPLGQRTEPFVLLIERSLGIAPICSLQDPKVHVADKLRETTSPRALANQ